MKPYQLKEPSVQVGIITATTLTLDDGTTVPDTGADQTILGKAYVLSPDGSVVIITAQDLAAKYSPL